MLFRFLLLVLVAYFVVKTVRNLIRAMRRDGQPPVPPPRVQATRPNGEPVGPRRPVFRDEVEDARYKDL